MHWPGLDSKAAAALAVSAGLPMVPAAHMRDPNAIRLNQKAIEALRQQGVSSEGTPSCMQECSNTKRSNVDTMSHVMPAESSGRSVQELRSPSHAGSSALAKAAAAAAAGMWPGEWPPQPVPGMSADDIMRLLHASRATEVLQRLPSQWGPMLSGSQVSSGHRPSKSQHHQQQQQQLLNGAASQDLQQQLSLPGQELPAAHQLLAALQSRQGSLFEPGGSVSTAGNSGSAASQPEQKQRQQRHQQQQQQASMPPPHPHLPQQSSSGRRTVSANGHRSSSTAGAAVATAPTAAAAVAGGGPSSSTRTTPEDMRARLGNRNYYMIRAMLLQQQETFVQQVFELHRLHRTQQHLSAELNSPEYQMTAQFAKEAVAVMRSLTGGANPSGVTTSPVPPAAAIIRPRTPQITKATAEEVAADDGGAAAVAVLSVHMALMPQVPSAMRRVVPQPTDFRGMEPSRYQVRRDTPGIRCPIPSRFVPRNSNAAGGPAMSGDTVEAGRTGNQKSLLGKRASPCVSSGEQPGAKRQLEWAGVNAMAGGVKAGGMPAAAGTGPKKMMSMPEVPSGVKLAQNGSVKAVSEVQAPSVGAGRECGSDDMQMQTGSGEQQEQQQEGGEEQQSKDLGGGSQMQGQVSSGAATAAAAIAGPLAAAAAAMAGTAGAVAAVAAAGVAGVAPCMTPTMGAPLNVFRPNPQISPAVASRFLAGDPLHNRGFDPHSYWMKKHYGNSSSQQQGPAASQGDTQQQQEKEGVEDRVSPAPAAAATVRGAAVAVEVGTATDPAAPKVVHWWQNAEATFGEPGLIDPMKPSKPMDGAMDMEHQR